jgi:DNA-binding GntR family transcriptional regulator
MAKAAQQAYEAIRGRILSGEFPPGLQLREEMLAREIGVSRTPIRDALRRLLADGLVETTPNQGSFVSAPTPEEMREVFELRVLLEGFAARKAASRITEAQLSEMERLADAMEAMAGDTDARVTGFAELNAGFHLLLARAAGSPQLEGMLVRVFRSPLVLLKQYRLGEDVGIERSNRQHREILAALRARNAEWASLAVSAHLVSTIPETLEAAAV